MQIIEANSQSRVKDRFASAPIIDLTVRTNGENVTQVIDSIGNIIPAGIEAPTSPPSVTTSGSVLADSAWTADKFWNYVYVYVIKNRFPLIKNAITPGGSQAPRSNPSPDDQSDSGTDQAHARIVTIPTSSRIDVSHIWIFRTDMFDTTEEADTFSEAGEAFYIGEIANDPNQPTVAFADKNFVLQEQIETDNFLASTARYCVFADPYFFLIGNDVLRIEVTISSTGLATIANPSSLNRWFSGRNGQIATFDGITRGGFDNYGSFYFKLVSDSTAQMYQDIALTSPIGVNPNGTTMINIRGPSTTLYRSKPYNPLSWGFTDLIDNLQIPQPYAFAVGGGRCTSLCVIPNLNLLKIDIEDPNGTYTLNLKNAGTPNFEPSLRKISDSYVSSVNEAQFSATSINGRNLTWALDTKSFAIIECDGSSQVPVSDPIWKSLRNLSLMDGDREFFHSNYHPRLDLNCIFVRLEGAELSINRCFYFHWPTKTWGTIDTFDVLASAQMLNPFTKELELIVGSSEGMIGEFGSENKFNNWTSPYALGRLIEASSFVGSLTVTVASMNVNLAIADGIIGNWIMLWEKNLAGDFYLNFRYAKITNVTLVHNVSPAVDYYKIEVEATWYNRDFAIDANSYPFPYHLAEYETYFIIGALELQIGKFYNGGIPFDSKKLQTLSTTFFYPNLDDTLGAPTFPSIGLGMNYNFKWTLFVDPNTVINQTRSLEYNTVTLDLSNPQDFGETTVVRIPNPTTFSKSIQLPVDQSSIFGIIISDRNTVEARMMNYEIRLNLPEGGS